MIAQLDGKKLMYLPETDGSGPFMGLQKFLFPRQHDFIKGTLKSFQFESYNRDTKNCLQKQAMAREHSKSLTECKKDIQGEPQVHY